MTEAQLSEMMGIPLMVEKPHETLAGVSLSSRDPEAVEIVGLTLEVIKETGAILKEGGYASLGAFVAEALASCKGSPEERSAVLLERVRSSTAVVWLDSYT